MSHIRPYDRDAGVQLLKRAFERSRCPTLRAFARQELVRDEATVRAYLHGRPIPRVVRDKLEQLARRRRRREFSRTLRYDSALNARI